MVILLDPDSIGSADLDTESGSGSGIPQGTRALKKGKKDPEFKCLKELGMFSLEFWKLFQEYASGNRLSLLLSFCSYESVVSVVEGERAKSTYMMFALLNTESRHSWATLR
jgi:hypothetical protein